jgi:uncharacterized protein
MTKLDTINRMYELFAAQNNAAIRAIFSEDIKWNQMKGFPNGGQYIGPDAVFENVFNQFSEKWTGWKAVTERMIETEEGVITQGYYEGTYKATGRYMKAEFMSEYKVKDGLITEFNQYTDTFLIAEAMNPGGLG